MPIKILRFDANAEVRGFERGRFEVLQIGGETLGRASYEPGWRWSTHVGAAAGAALCDVGPLRTRTERAAFAHEETLRRSRSPFDGKCAKAA